MKQEIFEKKINLLIEEAISNFNKYEELFRELFPLFLEYDDPNTTKERRREIMSLEVKGLKFYEKGLNTIDEIGKHLNSHDMDIALRRIHKCTKTTVQLWEEYEQWKTARSTMVV